jgi:hypothetical protein
MLSGNIAARLNEYKNVAGKYGMGNIKLFIFHGIK